MNYNDPKSGLDLQRAPYILLLRTLPGIECIACLVKSLVRHVLELHSITFHNSSQDALQCLLKLGAEVRAPCEPHVCYQTEFTEM